MILKLDIMKQKIIYSVFIILTPVIVFSQDWGGIKPAGFWDHWSVNANAGLTSYFGDLSYHDSDVYGKLNFESGPAFGIMVTKHFNKLFGLSGELIYGNIEGGNDKSISFKTHLLEYNVQARLDFIKLFSLRRIPKFGLEGHVGLGQFFFQSTTYEISEGKVKTSIQDTGVPEFVYFFGAGAHYHLGQSFAITAELSLHKAHNDRLDNLVKNNNFDYYNYTSIGLTYYIDSFKRTPLKNKARLAHSGKRKI